MVDIFMAKWAKWDPSRSNGAERQFKLQTIGLFAHLKGKGLDGPYLVIAPLSTLSNWVNEISRFDPSGNAIIYHGDKKQIDEIRRKHMPRTIGPKFPIIITSYEVALNDARST